MLMSKSLIAWKLHIQSGHCSSVTINGYLPAMEKGISIPEDPEAEEVTPRYLDRFLFKTGLCYNFFILFKGTLINSI